MLLPVLAALASGLALTGLQIIFKHYARPETSPLAIPAIMGLLAPVWAAMFYASTQNQLLDFNFTPVALAFPFGWAVCTVSTTCVLVWLLSYFSLTEVTGYKKALITAGALLADIFIFQVSFQPLKLVAIAFLLYGALTLSRTRNRMPTANEFFILLIWCTVLTLQIILYREGQLHQPEVLSLTILAQLSSSVLYALLWLMPSVHHGPKLPLPALLGILGCALTGTLLEGFAYAALPLAVVMLLTILPATLFAAHDLFRRDLTPSRTTLIALATIALGILILFFA